MRAQLSTHDYEQLSAYLDGQLASGERTKLEANLKTRPELQTALEDLRQTRAMLRMAPRKRAPRNFTLTPAMVGDMPPARKARRGWSGFNFFPVLSFASAVTVLLLVAVLFFDLGSSRTAMQAAPAVGAVPNARLLSTQTSQLPQAPAAGSGAGQSAPLAATSAPAANDAATTGGPNPPAPEAASKAAGSNNSSIPGGPMNWYGAYGRGGGGAGGAGFGAAADPRSAVIQQYGLNPDGSLSIPPQAVQSPPSAQADLSAGAAQAAQPNAQISGTGPILGVPSADQAGKVIKSQGDMGHPEQVTPVATTAPAPATLAQEPTPAPHVADQPVQEPVMPWYTWSVAGFPALRFIEGGLLLIALITGAAAVIVWRQRR